MALHHVLVFYFRVFFLTNLYVCLCRFTFVVSRFCRFVLPRRVVAVGVDPDVTAVSEVMTPNPTSVSTGDSAMEALGIMVERHFRHLPVRASSLVPTILTLCSEVHRLFFFIYAVFLSLPRNRNKGCALIFHSIATDWYLIVRLIYPIRLRNAGIVFVLLFSSNIPHLPGRRCTTVCLFV